VDADRHALPELELRDRLARPRDRRLLAGDQRQVPDRALDQLGIPGRLTDAHVHHDLGERGHLHDVGEAELLAHRWRDLVLVALFQPGRRNRLGHSRRGLGLARSHQMSLPLARETRTLLFSSSYRYPARAGFLLSGSTRATLLTWMNPS